MIFHIFFASSMSRRLRTFEEFIYPKLQYCWIPGILKINRTNPVRTTINGLDVGGFQTARRASHVRRGHSTGEARRKYCTRLFLDNFVVDDSFVETYILFYLRTYYVGSMLIHTSIVQ